jgi:hypothetical protein
MGRKCKEQAAHPLTLGKTVPMSRFARMTRVPVRFRNAGERGGPISHSRGHVQLGCWLADSHGLE